MSQSIWIRTKVGRHTFEILNLDHPEVEAAVRREIESGVDVYYDRRWNLTQEFCDFLALQPQWVTGRSVLILGAGIGMETLLIGRLCRKLYVNDLAPVALDLCARQLKKNRIHNFELLPGRYEALRFPPLDIVVGCNVVYNPETARAMREFMTLCPQPVLLMNDTMPYFEKLVKTAPRRTRSVLSREGQRCVLFQ